MDENGGVRRHTEKKKRDDRYCLRTGVNDSGTTSRKLLSTHRRGRGWWCAPAPNNASMVTVYAPAGTTVEQRVESYYPRTGVDEGSSVRRHTV